LCNSFNKKPIYKPDLFVDFGFSEAKVDRLSRLNIYCMLEPISVTSLN